MSEWQPIETAPKDGSWQAVARLDSSNNLLWWYQARWVAKRSQWRSDRGGPLEPSHYLPLPKSSPSRRNRQAKRDDAFGSEKDERETIKSWGTR